ncbi:MAG TPA: DUF6616 family protein [Fodinibius sp.]|nr:DUF6616 family protein [Fodinibius sp.]
MEKPEKNNQVYFYVEFWRFRPAWIGLTPDERKSWMDKLLAGLGQQIQSGVELIGFALNDEDTTHSSGYDFLAVWKMPNKEIAMKFEDFVEASGLHEYYEQVNTRGQSLEMEEMVTALLNTQK